MRLTALGYVVVMLILTSFRSAAITLAALVAMAECEGKEEALDRRARSALANVLIDPTAFLVRDLATGSDPLAICGAVNGKNRFGAFTGFSPFIAYVPESGDLEIAISSGTERNYDYQLLFHKYCESPIERTHWVKNERASAKAASEREAAFDAERAAERNRMAIAAKKRVEADKVFARLIGPWSAEQYCTESRDVFRVSRDTISFPYSVFTVRAYSMDGNEMRIIGKTITSSSIGDLGHLDFTISRRNPIQLQFSGRSYFQCVT